VISDCFFRSTRPTLKWSGYFPAYDALLEPYLGKPITLVEVGVGRGGSLQMWRFFFGSAVRIVGIDIDPATKQVERDGFEIFIGDQASPKFWQWFFERVGPVDVLIDDGGHSNLEQIVTVAESIPHIQDGGVIIVEDTHTSYMDREFGTPNPYDFMHFAAHIVDLINDRNPEVTSPQRLATIRGLGISCGVLKQD